MLRLLGRATSGNVQKVMWLLDELQVPYARENIGGPYGGNREPAYLKLNPNGIVPTLIDGDFVLWESNAILRYIARRQRAFHLYPQDLKARALIEQWLEWQTSALTPAMIPLFVGVIFEQRAPGDMPEVLAAIEAKLLILNAALEGRTCLCGDAPSLAEFALGGAVYRWFHFAAGAHPLPSLEAWYERLAERPAFQANVMVGVPNFTPKS